MAYLEGKAIGDPVGRVADEELELTGLYSPHPVCRIIEGESILIECKLHFTGLAGSEVDLSESLQLLIGAIDRAFLVAHIELHHFRAFTVACIGHRHCHRNTAVAVEILRRYRRLSDLEGGIAEAMAESVVDAVFLQFVGIAVAYVKALCQYFRGPVARYLFCCRDGRSGG